MICWHFLLHLPEVPLLLPGGGGVGSGGPKGPFRWPKATSPLQELEVGAHRAPYLLVIYRTVRYSTVHYKTVHYITIQ